MLTPAEEKYCLNREINRMTQYAAYLDAFPQAQRWKRSTVDEHASRLAAQDKIKARCKELRDAIENDARTEAKWTREDAFNNLHWLMEKAKEEVEIKGEITSPVVSAITNSVKELNSIYAVTDSTGGKGVLEDILTAVRGINND